MKDDYEGKKRSLIRQPGRLRGDASMEIQTRQAQRLVYGRRAQGIAKPAIVGLTRFAAQLMQIWNSAAKDDPWADWLLVQVERELIEGRESIEHLMKQVNGRLKSAPAVNVDLAQSIEPIKVSLMFTSPYAFMGAYLLADFDELVRAILTCRHVGLFDRDTADRTLREGGRMVRRTFNSSQGYRQLAVCREDVRQGTARGARALEMLGPLPQEVIDGTLRADHAPEIRFACQDAPRRQDEDEDDWDDDTLDGSLRPAVRGV